MVKLEHIIYCRRCKLYMELGAFSYKKGYFEGPYVYQTTERVDSDWALRRFLEMHGRHNIGFASDVDIDEIVSTGFGELSPTDAYCMSFVSRGESGIYRFEKFSKRFEKVLFIVDVYDWAWDIASVELLRFLPNVRGTIVDLTDFRKMEFHPEDWDMVLVYPWFHPYVMKKLDPRNTIVCIAGGEQLEMRRQFNLNCGRFVVYGANNKAIQKTLQKRFPKKRIVLLSHGVDTERFKPNPIPHDEFTVGWVGATKRKSKRFWFAEQITADIGAKLKVASREENYIPHEKMPEFYNSIDALLITSEYEAHPLIAYEAMSCGVPIVGTNVGDLWETIENGVSGFIFDPCSEKKMLPEALKLLRDDPKLRRTMGEEARRMILQKWKWEFIANQYRALGKTSPLRRELPKITVVTAVKNRVETIRRCIDSVLCEDYPNLEYIIIDGKSDDGTLEILREYDKKHGFIKVISEADRNQSEARNKGLKIATGDFITFQDSDDEMIDGKLGILSEFLLKSEKHFAAFGNTIFRNTEGKVTATNRTSIPSEINFQTLIKSNYIGSGAIMLRNSPDLHFDEDKRFGEDYSLWLKLVAKYPIAYLDFDAYHWTQASPDGIGANLPDWRDIDIRNRTEARGAYASSPHKSKMKIAVFCDTYGFHPFGGPAIYGYNICEMLYRSRVDYTVFYNPLPSRHPHPNYYRRKEFMKPRPDEIDVDDFNVFYVMNSPKAVLALNRKGILPIIGSNHITNSAPEHCLKYLTEKELISRGHQIGHEQAFLRNYKGKFWFAQSKFQMNEYQRVGMNLNETRVYLAPNPTDIDLFKRRDGFGDAIIWSGKNNWAKGIPFLEKVAQGLPDRFLCLWGGEGKELPIMPQNITVIKGNTLFHMPKFLEQGKIFLSTSVTENQPCAVLEAMSMELPVVGFRTSGMPEVIEDGETGFLVELDDTKAMIKKIKILLNDESLRREMGQKARKFVVDNFSYYKALDVYVDYFKLYLEA